MRLLLVVILCICYTIVSGCISSSPSFKKKSTIYTTRKPILPKYEERATSKCVLTFIDTINRENELRLVTGDFDKESKMTESGFSNPIPPESLYRIQVFASNRIETIREQKKELEKKTDEPVTIGYEAPFYKLYAGEFNTRQNAQSVLLKLRQIGYSDAWILSPKMAP